MRKWLLGLTWAWLGVAAAAGAIELAPGTPVAQDFDALGTNATAVLPADWKVDKLTTVRLVGTYAAAGAATEQVAGNDMGSTSANGIYNYGAGVATDAVDRAVGWISSGTGTKSGNLYVQAVNAGTEAITSLAVAYQVEKYRNGSNGAGFHIQLYYSTDGAAWTSAGASFLTAFPADADNSGFASAPGATVPVAGVLDLSSTPVAAGGMIYLAWNYSVQSGTTTTSAQALGVDSISISIPGPPVFSVALDQPDGFQVEEGAGAAIMASAANGTEPYGYSWSSTLDPAHYATNGNLFTILLAAPLGDYSATVVASDASDPFQTATNTVAFAVVLPAPKYAIAITPPTNGTVATIPATEAMAGATVTILATPDENFAVNTLLVVDDAANPVPLSGATFTMPATGVTVTVTFKAYVPPDVLIDFETATGFNSYAAGTSTVSGISFAHQNVLRGNLENDKVRGDYAARFRPVTGTNAFLYNPFAFDRPIAKIGFWHANYGTEDGTTFRVQVSPDGLLWVDAGPVYDPEGTNLTEAVLDDLPPYSFFFKFVTVSGTSRLNLDDLGLYLGPAVFKVTVDQTDGFTVGAGTGAAIVATATNGTEPYTYAWDSTLGAAYYLAESNVFTILPSAPLGDYSATVTATDSSEPVQEVAVTVDFAVATLYGITITAPVNGSVATTPATEAAAGAPVTINATPAEGYVVDAVEVLAADSSPVAVGDNVFTMPAQAVTVSVTFKLAPASTGALIISQYYEGASNNKWIELYNPGNTDIDLAVGGYRLGLWSNTSREAWKTGTAPGGSFALTGTIPANSTYLLMNSGALLPAYAVANQIGTIGFNGDDSVVIYTGSTYAFANVVDAVGLTNTTETAGANKSFVRKSTVTAGVNTDFNPADWEEFSNAAVDAAAAGTNERLGYHGTGVAAFSVVLDQPNGFSVDQGAAATITATAANGTAPYGYAWETTLAAGDYSTSGHVFTILATTALGDYSATVVATDASDPVQSASNTVSFSVVPPAQKYAITITPPVNGMVTTTPATEAAAGTAVTIHVTPDEGFTLDSIELAPAASLTGNTFIMPAEAVAVTVTFKPHVGSALIISEVADPDDAANAKFVELYNAGTESIDLAAGQWYLARQANGTTWADIALTGTVGAAQAYVLAYNASSFAESYPAAPAPSQVSANISGNGDDGYFLYSGGNHSAGTLDDAYGVVDQDGTGMPWEYQDKRAVRQASVTSGNPTWTAPEWMITTALAVDMTPGVHPDAAPVYGVTLNRTNGFTVQPGSVATITATAVNGTAPYSYAWSSSLWDSAADANVFTILATAPPGSYWAQVVASDSSEPPRQATNMVNFTVAAPAGGQLIISQYYEGTSNNKWIEIYNAGAAAVDLAAGGYRLAQFSNTNREAWKTNGAPGLVMVLSNSLAAGGTYLVANSSAVLPAYATANQVSGSLNFNGDDSIILFKGATFAFSNVVDAIGLINTNTAFGENKSFVRTNTVSEGVNTDFNAAEWIEYSLAAVEEAAADANERLGYHSVIAGEENPPIPPIVFVADVGFTFTLPEGYTLVRVEGADSVDEISQAWNWTTLASPGDYAFDGTTVTVLSSAADQRMIRIWLAP